MRASILLLLAVAVAEAACGAGPAGGKVVRVIQDFEAARPGGKRPVIESWRWSPEQKKRAAEFSAAETVAGTPYGKQCCRLTLTDKLPWAPYNTHALRILPGLDYLPPKVDAVRFRAKVLEGEFTLTVGGPTIYFGHSDVYTEPQKLTAGADRGWKTVEFSLHHRLIRNFRRAGLGRNAPVIYYTRWIQEPMRLIAQKPSKGVILLDQFELVSHGQSRPYPTIPADSVRKVATIADFEDVADMAKAFTLFYCMHDGPDFTKPPYLLRKTWAPPVLKRVSAGKGRFALQSEKQVAEETCFTGIKAAGVAEANAVRLRLKASHPAAVKDISLDFMAVVAPDGRGKDFAWAKFQPPVSWRKSPAVAFDYYLSKTSVRDADFGYYHARRGVPNGQWTTVVLPMADFVCAAGVGKCETMLKRQLPLTGGNIVGIAFLASYRHRSDVTRVLVDELAFVSVDGEPAGLRSFRQMPDVGKLRLVKYVGPGRQGVQQVSRE